MTSAITLPGSVGEQVYPLVADPRLGFDELIAAGKYERFDPRIIRQNFPQGRRLSPAATDAQFIHPNAECPYTDQILPLFEFSRLREGTMLDLLRLGAEHRSTHSRYMVVALGSVWQDLGAEPLVGCIMGNRSRRELCLISANSRWSPLHALLAVQDLSSLAAAA